MVAQLVVQQVTRVDHLMDQVRDRLLVQVPAVQQALAVAVQRGLRQDQAQVVQQRALQQEAARDHLLVQAREVRRDRQLQFRHLCHKKFIVYILKHATITSHKIGHQKMTV